MAYQFGKGEVTHLLCGIDGEPQQEEVRRNLPAVCGSWSPTRSLAVEVGRKSAGGVTFAAVQRKPAVSCPSHESPTICTYRARSSSAWLSIGMVRNMSQSASPFYTSSDLGKHFDRFASLLRM